jgi:hypothetical protein
MSEQKDPTKGVKNDKGKDDWSLLLDMPVVEEAVKVLTFGAKKYAAFNYMHVKGWRWRYLSAGMRHLKAIARGEKVDEESGLSHVGHFLCCMLMLADNEFTNAPNGDSRETS